MAVAGLNLQAKPQSADILLRISATGPTGPTPPRFTTAPMPSRQAKLQEDTYFRVMRILQDNPDLT